MSDNDEELVERLAKTERARDQYLLKLKRVLDIVCDTPISKESASVQEGLPLRCSFCNKGSHDVLKLIAGPSVYICDECVGVCVQIIAEDSKPLAPPTPEASA